MIPPPENNTILDNFIIELHYASERMLRDPVACVVPIAHPIATGLPPSIYGIAAAYDRGLTVSQGVIFFDDLSAFNRYVSQIKP